MLKKLFVVLFLLVINIPFANSQIVEIAHFKELISYLTPQTLLVLDIDDTLLLPVQMLGCDEWFKRQWKHHEKQGLSPEAALNKAVAEWEAIRKLTKMRIVEEGSDEIVRQLQEQGYRMIGLTTQGLGLSTRTILQLAEHNLDLSLTAPSQTDYYLSGNHFGVLFRKGVLFTSASHKGEAVFSYLDSISYHPQRIVFINDKDTHLLDLQQTSESRGIEFIGLRYAFADAHKARYRHEIAEFQFANSTIHQLLSDEEALILLETKKD